MFSATDATEAFYKFTRKHEYLQIDDLILTLGTAFSFYLTIFALRRWAEATKRLGQANTDILTGLFNRRKGWDVLEFEIARAKRYHRPLSLIMFDIDHFKAVNDTYGHLVGDRILRLVTKTIQEKLRNTDILVRWGGEEFMVISPETGLDEAREAAERLRKEVASCSIQNNIHTSASFGVVQLQEDDDFNALFQRVDEKLYVAKSTGRNRVA
jgi:diguanylate cyclase (GGDEF)-like protein